MFTEMRRETLRKLVEHKNHIRLFYNPHNNRNLTVMELIFECFICTRDSLSILHILTHMILITIPLGKYYYRPFEA